MKKLLEKLAANNFLKNIMVILVAVMFFCTTLYASYLEQTPLYTLQNMGKEFIIKVFSKDDKMTTSDIKDAFLIRGKTYSQIIGTTNEFEEEPSYSIRLNNDNLIFDDYTETVLTEDYLSQILIDKVSAVEKFIDVSESVDSINRYINGSLDGNNPETYSFSDSYKPIYAPTKPRYKFNGWYIDPALEKELEFLKLGVLTFANYHEQMLYAKMLPIEYKDAFYQGTENVSPVTHTINYGQELNLDYYSSNIKNNKAGYTLLGWATKKDSSEV